MEVAAPADGAHENELPDPVWPVGCEADCERAGESRNQQIHCRHTKTIDDSLEIAL